jgi:glucosamine-phosphate N-acetyltransferase
MSEVNYVHLIDLLYLNPHNIENIKNQYLLLLSNLTSTNFLETKIFVENVEKINKMGAIVIGIINDCSNNYEIVATGTIIIEPKIIRGGKNVGHIEDIVVANHMRGKGISQKILNMLRVLAREKNCYKVILDCSEEVKNVYTKNGFKVKGVQMAEYFV